MVGWGGGLHHTGSTEGTAEPEAGYWLQREMVGGQASQPQPACLGPAQAESMACRACSPGQCPGHTGVGTEDGIWAVDLAVCTGVSVAQDWQWGVDRTQATA